MKILSFFSNNEQSFLSNEKTFKAKKVSLLKALLLSKSPKSVSVSEGPFYNDLPNYLRTDGRTNGHNE